MGAIFRKEMRTYFTTISGYGFLGFFALITGYFFIGQNIVGSSANYNDTLTGSMIMFLILVPVLTMTFCGRKQTKNRPAIVLSTYKSNKYSCWKVLSCCMFVFYCFSYYLCISYCFKFLWKCWLGYDINWLFGIFLNGNVPY